MTVFRVYFKFKCTFYLNNFIEIKNIFNSSIYYFLSEAGQVISRRKVNAEQNPDL